jgi:hypothetical protein
MIGDTKSSWWQCKSKTAIISKLKRFTMKVQADYKYSSSARKQKKMKDGNFKGYIKYYS